MQLLEPHFLYISYNKVTMVGHEYILEILGAEFSYNGKDKIFEDINFTFEEKDVLCILGIWYWKIYLN